MNLKIRSMLPVEQKYTYAQSQQLRGQTGSIGHLRGDFDSTGNGFFTTWEDHRRDLKTDEFKQELDDVVNILRFDEHYDGLLKNRNAMLNYCGGHADSGFRGNYSTDYGFRADTENYAYLIRCNPNKGDYNFYCFCYQSSWLDKHIQNASRGIRFIDPNYNEKFRITDGDSIHIAISGGEKLTRVCRYIDEYHLEVGQNLYHICEFAERMEQNGNTVLPIRSSLPEQCYSTLPDTGELIIIKRGESGYYRTDMHFTGKEDMRRFADETNGKLGVSKAQESAMLAGSMFGWQVPGADPKSYTEDGKPVPPKHKDRGDAR